MPGVVPETTDFHPSRRQAHSRNGIHEDDLERILKLLLILNSEGDIKVKRNMDRIILNKG